jgi:hypothetical protein
MSESVKEILKGHRKEKAAKQEAETIVDELGEGVEPIPVEPEKPEFESLPVLEFGDAKDVQTIVNQIRNLPEAQDVDNQLKKIDAYEEYAKKIWRMKRSEDESFAITMRTIERIDKKKIGDAIQEKMIWKRDANGKIVTSTKTFYYTGITMQERDELTFLESAMQDAHFNVIDEGVRINKMTRDPNTTDEQFRKYQSDKIWQQKKVTWEKSIQDYYIAVFKAYYGATDEDIKHIIFDDIINYSEIALYKGGVKSPK